MPRPSQENKILDAALDCFAERGYEGTTIRHIAEAAGVTEGAIYRHYPTKEAVAQSLFSQYLAVIAAAMQEAARPGAEVKEQLQEIARRMLELYRENPAAATFVLLRKHNFMPKESPDTVYPLEIIAALIKEGQAQQLVRPGHPGLLGAIFLGCIFQPVTFSGLSRPGAYDLRHETVHDEVISEAAWAAVSAR